MGHTLPFSSIDRYFEKIGPQINGCIVDSHFLIAVLYDVHVFYEDADFIFQKLNEYKVPIYSTVTTRSEFIDIQRRITITEALMEMLAPNSRWRLPKNTFSELMKHKNWIDSQGKKEEMPILSDKRIKDCKSLFRPKKQSGHNGWLEVCEFFLKDKLEESWDNLVEAVGINYIQLREADDVEFLNKKVTWKAMYELSEKTCMGSSDAMIYNIFQCSKFPVLFSADYDMAYASTADSDDKVVFVPDAMFRGKVKFLGNQLAL